MYSVHATVCVMYLYWTFLSEALHCSVYGLPRFLLTCCWCCLAACWTGRSGPGLPGRPCRLPQRAAPCAETLMAFGSVWDTRHGLQACIRHTQGGRHRTQTQDALAACTHTGAPSASTWLWVSKVKFPQRLLDLESACYPESVKGTLLTLICWVEIQGSKTDLRSVSEGSFYLEVRLLLNLRSWTRFSYSQNISI